jgi:AAA family ATP:ADP antiporter
MKENIQRFYQEIIQYSLSQKIFILCAMLCGFCINAEYAIIRPVSNSLFIQAYGSHWFPYAWLAAVPLNFLFVSLYNHFLPKMGALKMGFIALFSVMGGNLFFACISSLPTVPFIFYIWKETYILLMFQQLWSVIHSAIDIKKAKYLYGLIFGIGGLGAAFGCLVPSFLAVKIGSEALLFFSTPLYLLLFIFYFFALKQCNQLKDPGLLAEKNEKQLPSFLTAFKLIRGSKCLFFIMAVVVLMQVSSTLIDFQFNTVLEHTIKDKDLRTAYFGKVMGIVQIATILLQFVGTFLLVQLLGIRRSHFLIPFLLCLNVIGFLFFPAFGMISFAFITIKAFDFSLFGIIKEMLYIPLKLDEKFRAKAVIDVFAYRSAKAFASFLIIAFQLVLTTSLIQVVSIISILLFLLWAYLVSRLLKQEDLVVYS